MQDFETLFSTLKPKLQEQSCIKETDSGRHGPSDSPDNSITSRRQFLRNLQDRVANNVRLKFTSKGERVSRTANFCLEVANSPTSYVVHHKRNMSVTSSRVKRVSNLKLKQLIINESCRYTSKTPMFMRKNVPQLHWNPNVRRKAERNCFRVL